MCKASKGWGLWEEAEAGTEAWQLASWGVVLCLSGASGLRDPGWSISPDTNTTITGPLVGAFVYTHDESAANLNICIHISLLVFVSAGISWSICEETSLNITGPTMGPHSQVSVNSWLRLRMLSGWIFWLTQLAFQPKNTWNYDRKTNFASREVFFSTCD